ncbi:uncharacterized protein BDZ99DRAFT_460425 [Mytilinidion resinicola]|uniref:Uncharacterized protein n=1 Tax=Mytilinidion resinicola TaxID=574789 RepID=A0A6A6YWF7_9PEZI|nr:uncharacterized protein BDZ99DRAFT_460425 [Mytilinidion resinicola]KAF2813131.1 hypothetical protein BDZ99DRAFT_460425 [Mytilinidion resinicola]
MLVRPSRVAVVLLLIIATILIRRSSDSCYENPGNPSSIPVKQLYLNDYGRQHDQKARAEIVEPSLKAAPKVAAEKAIVMGRLARDDVDWVAQDLPDWERYIYTVDNDNSTLHTAVNKGKEAMPYLTFIIDNYQNLPKTMAFLHSHRGGWPEAWHNDAPGYMAKNMLDKLKIDYVQRNGYANLRCIHNPGCPGEMQMFRQPPQGELEVEGYMLEVWQRFFNSTAPPHIIGTPCCAQFAVSRDQVLKRPLEDYVHFRRWLLETELIDDISGRIMEYLWHIIFGKEPVYCPGVEECSCQVFGRCDEYTYKAPPTQSSDTRLIEDSDRRRSQEVFQGQK